MKKLIFSFIIIAIVLSFNSFPQSIGNFNSVQPAAQTQSLVLPSTHIFQRIIKSGDALSLGGNLGSNLDFTGYVPISGSSANGYLSISSETTPAEVAILAISFNAGTQLWSATSGGKVPFPQADLGNVSRFCSGTVTPANTVIVAEEALTFGDVNADGYEDIGWLIEIDPATRTVVNQDGAGGPDKLWAAGRQSHENCVIRPDQAVMYWGADADPTGYLYKFVPSAPGNYSNGLLYALVTNSSLGTGTWVPIPNATQAQRNATVAASTSAGAYNFNGIEDVEMAADGKIYFTSKGTGIIYRFTDDGATVSGLEEFVSPASFDVDGAGPFAPEPWGAGHDNLAFDGEGNLWVLQDGGRNHIWVIGPTHTAASPSVRLFATTPAGCEPTGITFTPDFRFMFLSFMHPSGSNTSSQMDAAGIGVVFNTHTTVVVARKEFLGTTALPVRFLLFNATQSDASIRLKWTVSNASSHAFFAVERSTDGTSFYEIHRDLTPLGNGVFGFSFDDGYVVPGSNYYYRIRQCDANGACHYSATVHARLSPGASFLELYPVPAAEELNVKLFSPVDGKVRMHVLDHTGRKYMQATHGVRQGFNIIPIHIGVLAKGHYWIWVARDEFASMKSFVIY